MYNDDRIALAIVTGLRREITIALSKVPTDTELFAAGGRADLAYDQIRHWAAQTKVGKIVSFGIAGGLASDLPAGTSIIPRRVIAPDGAIYDTDKSVSNFMAERLPTALRQDLVGMDKPVASVADKAALFRRHGAAACDMESHGVARAAAELNIPFACLRVIADPATRALPAAARAGFGADGRIRVLAVLGRLLVRPGDIGALLALARDARCAEAALKAAVTAGALNFSIARRANPRRRPAPWHRWTGPEAAVPCLRTSACRAPSNSFPS